MALSQRHLLEWGLVSYDHRYSRSFLDTNDRNLTQNNQRDMVLLGHITQTLSKALALGMARSRFSTDGSLYPFLFLKSLFVYLFISRERGKEGERKGNSDQ